MTTIEDDILADLARRGLRSATTEAQARAYAAACEESERLTVALRDEKPGTPAHKRVSTALRGVGRERDTLARHLGITEQGRARPVKGPHTGTLLGEHGAWTALVKQEIADGKTELAPTVEAVERLSAQWGVSPAVVGERLGLEGVELRTDAEAYDVQQRAALAKALDPGSYETQAASRSGVSVERFIVNIGKVSLDEFRAYMGRDPE